MANHFAHVFLTGFVAVFGARIGWGLYDLAARALLGFVRPDRRA